MFAKRFYKPDCALHIATLGEQFLGFVCSILTKTENCTNNGVIESTTGCKLEFCDYLMKKNYCKETGYAYSDL